MIIKLQPIVDIVNWLMDKIKFPKIRSEPLLLNLNSNQLKELC